MVHPSQRASAFLVCLIVLAPTFSASAQKWARTLPGDEREDVVPGVLLVRFAGGQAPASAARSGLESFDLRAADLQVQGLERAFSMVDAIVAEHPDSEAAARLQGVYRLYYNAAIAPATAARWLAQSRDVDYVEPQYKYRKADRPVRMDDPNDPQYSSNQGYMSRLELDDAWDTVKAEDGDIVIAFVDDGIETSHPDLSGNFWVNPGETAGNGLDDDDNGYVDDIYGWNFESDTSDVSPEEGDAHGNQVGGTANAVTDNNLGVAGSAWNAKTMSVNVSCLNDNYYLCHTTEGILYAAANGADVINCSWSGYGGSTLLNAVQTALDSGALMVAAVGNDELNIDLEPDYAYPARYPHVLGVGATVNSNDRIAYFSNFGRSVDVFAAGADIATTTVDEKYDKVDGTSFSTPLVSGIVALVMTERPDLEPEEVRELIRLTADNIDSANNSSFAGLLGSGRANANAALTASLPPGVRLMSDTFSDANLDGIFSPGETITIEATFANWGSTASNVTVGFSDSDPYVDWTTATASAGELTFGESYTGTFTFDVADDVPENHVTTLNTIVTSGSFTDAADAIGVHLNYIRRFVTHETPTIKTSVARYGNLGHPDYRHYYEGSAGFTLDVDDDFDDFMYEGGLMLGTSYFYIADVVTNSTNSGQENDFVIMSGTEQTLSNPGSVGSQDGHVTLVESSTSNANLGVEVDVNSYTFDAAADDDYIILHYTIKNTSTSSLTNLHAGLYVDFDAGYPYDEDKARFDSQRGAGYVQRATGDGLAFGVRMLSTTGDLNYSALDVDGSVRGGFSNSTKFAYLSSDVQNTSMDSKDVSQIIGSGPMTVAAGASVNVAFALVSGNSSSDFLTNSDAAQSQWNSIIGKLIGLSANVASISEGAGATTVTVTAATGDGSNLDRAESISVTVAGSGAASAVDFAAVSPFTIAIASESSSGTGTFTLTPTDDSVDESNETITISSSHSKVTSGATVTITDDDATPSGITLTASADTVDEADGATTITLTGTVSGSTTFSSAQDLPISVAGSGTASAVDFNSVADFDLTIAAEGNSGSSTFSLTPVNDQTGEDDETVTISSTSSLVSNSPTIVLTDDDGGPIVDLQLSADISTLAEGAGATTVTVTAATTNGNAVSRDQSITVSVAGSGTASAVDFAAVADFTITVASGSSSGTGTFALTPTNDSVDETDETITISSSSALVSQNATITLTDNDAAPAGITLVVSEDTVDEGDGATTITLTGTVSGTTTFGTAQTYSISANGSGSAGVVDFAAVSDFDLAIAAEATNGTATFTLTPTDDKVDEVDETVTLSSTSKAVLNSPTVTLTDDDATPTGISLALSTSAVSEGAGTTTITVTGTVSGTTTYRAKQTLPISVQGSGTASAVDFAAVPNFNLEIAAEGTRGSATFTLTPVDDQVDETNETVTVSSSNSIATNSPTITLSDNDAPPSGITLTVNTTSVDEGAGTTAITLTGTVGGTTTYGAAQTLPISVAGSDNTNAVDFNDVPGFNLEIAAAGTTGSTTFTLTPVDDDNAEADETVTISSTSSAVSNAPTITIRDNDGGSAGTLGLSTDVSTVSEDAGATTITVTAATRDNSTLPSALTVTITAAGSGTASAVDFAAVSPFTITVASGSTSGTGTFTLTPTDDAVDESTETITISSASVQVTQSTTITLTDDDDAPTGISLGLSASSVDEGAGTTTITLTGTVGGSTTYAAPQTLPISVLGSGDADAVDFTAVADFDLVVQAAGNSVSATFDLIPEDDQVAEDDETITISSTSSLVTNTPTITLTDDDDAPTGIALAVSTSSVDEGAGTTTITLTGTVGGTTTYGAAQTLPISVSGSGNADAVDFTAVADFDLVVQAEGSSGSATFDLTPEDDQVPEDDETITISSTSSLATNAPTITITDNDGSGSVDLALSSDVTTLDEDAGATTITLTASTLSGDALANAATVPIAVTGSGEESAVDFIAASEVTLTIASGASSGTGTFTLTPTDDEVDESDESITLVSTGTLTSQTVTITLTDDDDAPTSVALSVSPDEVGEGDGATTITIQGDVTGGTTYGAPQTLPISVVPPQDADAVDFTAVADFDLVVEAASESGTITFELVPEDDDENESDADITIQSASSLVSNAPILVLLDDDGYGIELSLSHTEISENTSTTTVTVTATTSDGSTLPAAETIPIAVTGSGTEAAVDFDAVPAFNITIAQGDSTDSGTFELRPVDDVVDESDESITVSSTHALVTRSVVLSLTDDDAPPTGIALTATPDTVDEGDGATTVTLTSTVTGGTSYSGAQTLPISVAGSGLTDAVDFAAVAGFDLVIAAEGVAADTTFSLVPEDDQEKELDETITIGSTHSEILGTTTLTITDNDRRDITLSVSPETVSEASGMTTIAVTATVTRGTFVDAQTVPVFVAGSGIDAAVDFDQVQGFSITVDASAGSGTGSFTITPTDDSVDEVDEKIAVLSTHPSALDSAFVTLVDDDMAPLGITLAASPSTAYEDDGATQIAVTASVSGETQYADSQSVLITVAGSGITSAVDFDPVADFTVLVSAAAQEGLHYFVLNPVDDHEGESGERITISSAHPLVLNTAEVLLIDDDGGMTSTESDAPAELRVHASFPNPAASGVTFVVVVPDYTADVSLRVYNLLGQQVATPFVGALQAGEHTVRFDASTLPAGVYMYVVASPDLRHAGRFIVAR